MFPYLFSRFAAVCMSAALFLALQSFWPFGKYYFSALFSCKHGCIMFIDNRFWNELFFFATITYFVLMPITFIVEFIVFRIINAITPIQAPGSQANNQKSGYPFCNTQQYISCRRDAIFIILLLSSLVFLSFFYFSGSTSTIRGKAITINGALTGDGYSLLIYESVLACVMALVFFLIGRLFDRQLLASERALNVPQKDRSSQ